MTFYDMMMLGKANPTSIRRKHNKNHVQYDVPFLPFRFDASTHEAKKRN